MTPISWDAHPTKLAFDEFVPIARKLNKGQKIRVNHMSSECEGESPSMLITRNKNGMVIAYCFRCKRRGVYTGDVERTLPQKVDGRYMSSIVYVPSAENKTFTLPGDVCYEINKWPLPAKMFVTRARLNQQDITDHSIGYSPSLKKVVLPLHKEKSNGKIDGLIGYQLRRVFEDDKSPKYLTRKNDKDYFKHSHTSDDIVCVVEDYLSFVRVSKFVSTVCLFGTSLSPTVIGRLGTYKRVVVFLDNDNHIVKKQQRDIKRELKLFVNDVNVIESDKQPKEYTDKDLKSLFNSFNKE